MLEIKKYCFLNMSKIRPSTFFVCFFTLVLSSDNIKFYSSFYEIEFFVLQYFLSFLTHFLTFFLDIPFFISVLITCLNAWLYILIVSGLLTVLLAMYVSFKKSHILLYCRIDSMLVLVIYLNGIKHIVSRPLVIFMIFFYK